jgi:membrane protein YqaA with SNARE-associated domain
VDVAARIPGSEAAVTGHDVVVACGVYGGAFVVAAISSVIPFVSIDVFLVGIALAASSCFGPLVVVCAAAGQVVGKLPIYYATRGAAGLPGPQRARVDRLRAWLARWQRAPRAVLAASAVFGLPPFALAATAAGALGIRVREFCAVVFAGRALHFAIVLAIATAVR